ncbi:hypothetical protein GGR57DRAFT_468715 [Xylariaceae sp. FL1272]|nr:hypothetical protein GGR57DRAFT_468715 [Xylariaceae sp. FL1272]
MASAALYTQPAALRPMPEKPKEMTYVNADDLRAAFASAMSQMYKKEVPLYGDLIRIVSEVNKTFLSDTPTADSLERLILERHGAIRLGKPTELRTVRRIFALLGMHPVGYYDLSVAALPMHATCFRPIDESSLARNPFRVFTTLLRPDLIKSAKARDLALRLLSKRDIFSPELVKVLNLAEEQGNKLTVEQGERFILEALRTFCWAPSAMATHAEYLILKSEHPILADIVCFKTAHINHLTPRTLDIGAAQEAMHLEGMAVKERIEGPPPRKHPILLRQTSFLALEEPIQFETGDGPAHGMIGGSHKARFGEIEERGAAVTPAGRELYDVLLAEALVSTKGKSAGALEAALVERFDRYPDSWDELTKNGLVYYKCHCTGKMPTTPIAMSDFEDPDTVESLITAGLVETLPITYEDFLPFSAAGIFQSNLQQGNKVEESVPPGPDVGALEAALGCAVMDPNDLYAAAQQESLKTCFSKLQQLLKDGSKDVT